MTKNKQAFGSDPKLLSDCNGRDILTEPFAHIGTNYRTAELKKRKGLLLYSLHIRRLYIRVSIF